MNNLWFGLEIAATIFEAFIIAMFFNGFLGRCKLNRIYETLCWGTFAAVFIVRGYFGGSPVVTLLIAIFAVALLSFLYKGTMQERAWATSIFVVFLVVAEMLTIYGMLLFTSSDVEGVTDYGVQRLIGMVVSKIILFTALKAMVLTKKQYYVKIPFMYWLALLWIPTSSIIVVVLVQLFNSRVADRELFSLSFVSTCGVLYSNIIIFYLFDAICSKAELQAKSSILEKQLSAQLEHYQELETTNKAVQKIRHDMKNHLIYLMEQIDEINSPDAISYIQSLDDTLGRGSKYFNTGNNVLDCILNAKQIIIENSGIKLDCTVQIPEELRITPSDFCIIFGNAFDNAIESCARITDGAVKYINLSIAYRNSCLLCKIQNSTNGQVKRINDRYISLKPNAKNHGLGLENMADAIAKYGGTLNVSHSGNTFELKFVLMNV